MILSILNNSFNYELEKLCRIFFPFEKIEVTDKRTDEPYQAVAELVDCDTEILLKAYLRLGDTEVFRERKVLKTEKELESASELALATALFDCFNALTGYRSPWGVLTGVRPAKLYSRLCASLGEAGAEQYFKDKLLVTDKKISLCQKTHVSEEKIISLSKPQSFSLYIAIPFCPSRCSYCSFVSHSVEHAKKLIPQYVELLCEEIRETARYAKENGLLLETVYMGGGTPTTLNASQLTQVLNTVRESFDTANLRELTVEAGRPDTVTEEKLKALYDAGVTRISINPQTMNDDVLAAIGRRHTAEETKEAFRLARKYGFDNINMDLIAGLPSDTLESFAHTLDEVLELDPESVTVHSLSMKRAANLSTGGILPELDAGKTAAEMVDLARDRLTEKGINEYYMYRQSKTVGNLENVGYSKIGYECIYNVFFMDETHTILACGASAVTKLKEPNGAFIERTFNFKYPYEYITRFGEIIERKERIKTFYETYRIANQ